MGGEDQAMLSRGEDHEHRGMESPYMHEYR